MNTPANTASDSLARENSQAAAPPITWTRSMYWSVRRELWENRSLYVAPFAVAALYLFGFVISLFWMPHRMRGLSADHSIPPDIARAMPYSHAAMLLMAIGLIVGVFYSLDALHGERRDRSILFWKSLPVSDLTTVLSKASIPLVVLPGIVFAITVILQIAMRALATGVLRGGTAARQWTELPLFQMQLVFLYSLSVIALWHAPIYCWLLLVSGWAKRATILWAVLPPLAIAAVENIVFRTSYLGSMLHDRFSGFASAAFELRDKNGVPIDPHFIPLAQLSPGRFLSSAGLWIGLAVAAALLAAAVRVRHYREPI